MVVRGRRAGRGLGEASTDVSSDFSPLGLVWLRFPRLCEKKGHEFM